MLADFGLSKAVDSYSLTDTFCGTYDYLAPEILQGTPYNHAIDIWSLGIVIYEMFVGMPLFWQNDVSKMCHNIIYLPLDLSSRSLTSSARSLCLGLLNRKQSQRLSISDIKQHPFFEQVDWKKLATRQVIPLFEPQKV